MLERGAENKSRAGLPLLYSSLGEPHPPQAVPLSSRHSPLKTVHRTFFRALRIPCQGKAEVRWRKNRSGAFTPASCVQHLKVQAKQPAH